MRKALPWIVVTVVSTGVWFWYDYRTRPANERIQGAVVKLVERDPRLRPMYDEANEDGTITLQEANAIVNRANELMPPKAANR